jgi:hypothetical protein
MSGYQYRNIMDVSDVNGDGTGTITIISLGVLLTVNVASPTLTLTASPAGSMTFPGNVTLTATLAGAADNSWQDIEFTVNGAPHTVVATNFSGVAIFTFTPPNTGTYDFGASFAADANNNAATATEINGYVVMASPTLALAVSPAGSMTLPGNVTLTATLIDAANPSGQSIEFFVNGTPHTVATDASGVAIFTFTSPDAGTYDFGASFAGDVNNNAATATAINGYVVRPVTLSGNLASIPTLNPAMLVLLAFALAGLALRQRRQWR